MYSTLNEYLRKEQIDHSLNVLLQETNAVQVWQCMPLIVAAWEAKAVGLQDPGLPGLYDESKARLDS